MTTSRYYARLCEQRRWVLSGRPDVRLAPLCALQGRHAASSRSTPSSPPKGSKTMRRTTTNASAGYVEPEGANRRGMIASAGLPHRARVRLHGPARVKRRRCPARRTTRKLPSGGQGSSPSARKAMAEIIPF